MTYIRVELPKPKKIDIHKKQIRKVFTPKRQYNPPITLICENQNCPLPEKKFKVYQSEADAGRKYCSMKCVRESKSLKN